MPPTKSLARSTKSIALPYPILRRRRLEPLVLKRCNSNTKWATLHKELLELILERLHLADHARFSAVCKWWRSVAVDNPASNKFFSLIPTSDPASLIDSLLSMYWESWTSAVFVGSFQGWLVLQMDHSKLYLLKPASPLVALPLIPLSCERYFAKKVVLSSSPEAMSDCSIVLSDEYGLWFCRLGDTSWTLFSKDQIEDIVFYNNQLYAIDKLHQLIVFDSSFNPTKTPIKFDSFSHSKGRLVVAFHKLLMVTTRCFFNVSPIVELFEIHSSNFSYTRLEDIGDNILLLTPRASIFLPATYYQGFFPPNHLFGLWHRPLQEGFVLYSFHDKNTRVVETRTNGGYYFDARVDGKTKNGCPIFFTLFRLGR